MKRLLLPLLLSAATAWASTCDSGQRQSPIDITPGATSPRALPPLRFA